MLPPEKAKQTLEIWELYLNAKVTDKVLATEGGDEFAAVLLSEVVGIYCTEDKPSSTERMVELLEKQAGDGDEWKA